METSFTDMTKQKACDRIRDFLEFHNKSCEVDSIVGVLKEYLSGINADKETKEKAVLLYSLTYSVPSTVVILSKLSELDSNPQSFWKQHKAKLIFQSDRRWVKMCDKFVTAYFDFLEKGVFETFEQQETIDVDKAVNKICGCYYFSRFSAFLFLEAYITVFGKNAIRGKIDWKNGETTTSGILNVLGLDAQADLFDKKQSLVVDKNLLDKLFEKLIELASVGKNSVIMETNLCAYRKLFKGTRYLGYYADRILNELYKTIDNYPECEHLGLVFKARQKVIPRQYLGELNDWKGIRNQKTKQFKNTGDWR